MKIMGPEKAGKNLMMKKAHNLDSLRL